MDGVVKKTKVVYVDKPFVPKTMTSREKNTWYHKIALKALLLDPRHKGALDLTSWKWQHSTGKVMDDAAGDAAPPGERKGSVTPTDDLFKSDDIEDFETFGVSQRPQPKKGTSTSTQSIKGTSTQSKSKLGSNRMSRRQQLLGQATQTILCSGKALQNPKTQGEPSEDCTAADCKSAQVVEVAEPTSADDRPEKESSENRSETKEKAMMHSKVEETMTISQVLTDCKKNNTESEIEDQTFSKTPLTEKEPDKMDIELENTEMVGTKSGTIPTTVPKSQNTEPAAKPGVSKAPEIFKDTDSDSEDALMIDTETDDEVSFKTELSIDDTNVSQSSTVETKTMEPLEEDKTSISTRRMSLRPRKSLDSSEESKSTCGSRQKRTPSQTTQNVGVDDVQESGDSSTTSSPALVKRKRGRPPKIKKESRYV